MKAHAKTVLAFDEKLVYHAPQTAARATTDAGSGGI
jgi:hypothetical protein